MNQAFQPMLATLVAAPFNRAGWVNEEKYDGIRALAYRRGDKVQLFSRNQKQLTGEFPEIVRSLTGISGGDFVLDGEIVAFDSKNVSRFQLLQRRAIGKKVEPVFVVFDCLALNGKSIIDSPLRERRALLEGLMKEERGSLLLSRRLSPDGYDAFKLAQKNRWEGIIAKDDSSCYQPGQRSRSWLKIKCRKETEFVIGGYTAPQGHRHNFGALLVGLFDGQRLRFTGKVGTGYSEDVLSDLAKRMAPLRTPNCPFEPPPKVRTATWIHPTLVAQIAFAEWTDDEKLRQPAFLGVRDDIKPKECQWSGREK